MRIISGLAAGLAAMAIGSAAEARPGGGGPGHGGSASGIWFKDSGHRGGVEGGYGHFGPGPVKGRPGRHHGGDGRHGWGGFNPYGGGGIVGPAGAVDPYGNGFFNGGGGRIRLRAGHPYFDYDRSYPYEWASAARGGQERADEASAPEQPPRCAFENGVRVCRGW